MNLHVALNQKWSVGDLFRILFFIGTVIVLLFIAFLVYVIWSYYHISSTYELVEQGMTRQQVDEAIGWYWQTDITLSDVASEWEPRSSGDITECGFSGNSFYVVYEEGRVVEAIPSFE